MDEINEQRQAAGKSKAWSQDEYGSWKWPRSAKAVWQAINWYRGRAKSIEPGKRDRAFAEFIGRSRRTVQRGFQFLESVIVIDRGDPKGRIDGQRVITVIADLASSEPSSQQTESAAPAAPVPAAAASPTSTKVDSTPARARQLLDETRSLGCDIIEHPGYPGQLMLHPTDMAKRLPGRLKQLISDCREDLRRIVLGEKLQLE